MGKDLGNGVRKIRMAVKSKGKGKSGGMRVITFNVIIDRTDTEITLLSMAETVSPMIFIYYQCRVHPTGTALDMSGLRHVDSQTITQYPVK